MKIPKTFDCMGLTWKVKIENNILQRHGVFGLCSYPEHTIFVQKPMDGFSQEQAYLTFLHERVHCFLFSLNEYELNQNEKFVDTFAQLTLQYEKTRKLK